MNTPKNTDDSNICDILLCLRFATFLNLLILLLSAPYDKLRDGAGDSHDDECADNGYEGIFPY